MDQAVQVILSTPETEVFKGITDDMVKTFMKKNHDYGNSFFEDLDDEKDLGPARYAIGNKWRRFKQLSMNENSAMVEESIDDTLLDMANYCIMTLAWRKMHKNDISSNSESGTV